MGKSDSQCVGGGRAGLPRIPVGFTSERPLPLGNLVGTGGLGEPPGDGFLQTLRAPSPRSVPNPSSRQWGWASQAAPGVVRTGSGIWGSWLSPLMCVCARHEATQNTGQSRQAVVPSLTGRVKGRSIFLYFPSRANKPASCKSTLSRQFL